MQVVKAMGETLKPLLCKLEGANYGHHEKKVGSWKLRNFKPFSPCLRRRQEALATCA